MNFRGIDRSARKWIWLTLYVIALLASQLWTAADVPTPEQAPVGSERVWLGARPAGLSALHWRAEPVDSAIATSPARLPVLLLHGSPGAGSDFAALGASLATSGREVLALDLPGFGASASVVGGLSIEAHAAAALAACPWPEFHVAAWSMGGGVALHMAQLAPQRVRSLSQIAAIGVQEAEGSGSYLFEHVKYALSWALLVPGAELIPHFGLLGERTSRRAFCLNFWQSDQRPLRGILESLATPLLIAHGRDDFLVPLWCAQESHALVQESRLVVFAGSHFLCFPAPFGQLEMLAPELEAFFARHDVPDVREPRALLDLSVARPRAAPAPYTLTRIAPWWLALLCCAVFACWRPGSCGISVGALSALLQLDLGLGLIGAAIGASCRVLTVSDLRLRRWSLDLGRILLGAIVGALFAAWAGESLCRFAGAWGGLVASAGLPIAVGAGASVLMQRRRAAQCADV